LSSSGGIAARARSSIGLNISTAGRPHTRPLAGHRLGHLGIAHATEALLVLTGDVCWLAPDRALAMDSALRLGAQRRERARQPKACINARCLTRAFNKSLGSFTQGLDDEVLDASGLTVPLTGMLTAKDPRVVATVDAIERHLSHEHLTAALVTFAPLREGQASARRRADALQHRQRFACEGVEVGRLTRGDQVAVDDHLLIDDVGTCVAQVNLDGLPRGHPPALDDA